MGVYTICSRGLLFGVVAISAVVLFQFAVESFAANAEGSGGVSLIALGVVESCFNRLSLNLIHRRRHCNLKRRGPAFACRLRSFDLDSILLLQSNPANRFRQVFQFDLPS